jgi:hypothetical protein
MIAFEALDTMKHKQHFCKASKDDNYRYVFRSVTKVGKVNFALFLNFIVKRWPDAKQIVNTFRLNVEEKTSSNLEFSIIFISNTTIKNKSSTRKKAIC